VLYLPELLIHSGQITAIIGPNGSGKSTLLNLFAFLEKPNTGEIKFFDAAVNPKQHSQYRKKIGLLAQQPFLLRGTVLDNLKLTLKLHDIPKNLWQNNIRSTLEKLDISHLQAKNTARLSGGELQKSALALALITRPDVLILDEPFSYLDQTSNQRLAQMVTDYVAETRATLIFSTHDRLQGMALAHHVVALVNGEMIKSPLLNLYHGHCQHHVFDTDKIKIVLTQDIADCSHVSIDPHEIVLSKEPLISSMRNQFQGRITSITDEMGKVRIAVDAGELFQVLITYEALKELALHLGDAVWVNFKSNSVIAF